MNIETAKSEDLYLFKYTGTELEFAFTNLTIDQVKEKAIELGKLLPGLLNTYQFDNEEEFNKLLNCLIKLRKTTSDPFIKQMAFYSLIKELETNLYKDPIDKMAIEYATKIKVPDSIEILGDELATYIYKI